MQVVIILAACLLFATANGAEGEYTYDRQDLWGGSCIDNTGRQSPIDIKPGDAKVNPKLTDLKLGDGWKEAITGRYNNTGYTTFFGPTDPFNPEVLTTNYLGEYRVLQFHLHWGANDQEGSEHTIDGRKYPLAIHFVHKKITEADRAIGDDFAVIGVLGEAVDEPISGVWAKLNIEAIQSYPSSIAVSGLIYKDLLPSSLDYWHYPGSLTTPPCSEVVQWFVLKETIKVPKAYLRSLRTIESAINGTALTLNFRDVLPLGERTLETPGSGSPKVIASALSILVAMFITMYFS